MCGNATREGNAISLAGLRKRDIASRAQGCRSRALARTGDMARDALIWAVVTHALDMYTVVPATAQESIAAVRTDAEI